MNYSELDYYGVLNVKRNATKEDITIAYRKLAIKLCPFRDASHLREFVPFSQDGISTHMTPLSLGRQWEYINMAYDILGNDIRRSLYDRFGEAGLLQGVALPNGFFQPYQYHGNPVEVYHSVFGSYSPYANIVDAIVEKSPPLYSNKNMAIGVKTKDDAVVKVICLELEEVYKGCIKLMHVMRQEFVDANETSTEKKKTTLTLRIPAGVTAGTSFCFKEEGDRYPSKIPADIFFIVQDKPHHNFRRINQHDLAYRHKVNLCQALTGVNITIDTLDKRKLSVFVSDVVTPEYEKVIPGEGLPIPKSQDADNHYESNGITDYNYGNLVIEFSIVFPIYLTPAMKELTRKYFKDLQALENVAKKSSEMRSK